MDLHTAWTRVFAEASRLKPQHLRTLFADDPERFAGLSVSLDDLTIDFSKERLDRQALGALVGLAETAEVADKRDAMFAGAHVNRTEGRPALHMALRGGGAASGIDISTEQERFLRFADDVRTGRFRAGAGPVTDVVNIGIGGSDLGPSMAAMALRNDCDGPGLHFVSNVDASQMADVMARLDPARTLVVIASKSFETLETMANARTARDWLGTYAGTQIAAVSTNSDACTGFGVPEDRIFGFWDWVGGRYSIWSAVGLSVAIAIGADRFRAFLAGAAVMDRHFRTASLDQNLPILLALIGIWRRNAMGWPTVAVCPYDQRLARFPAYLQQLDMESNGKSVRMDGQPVDQATGPIVWGEPGTNAQHSFFQLLHQGSDIVPVDFIATARASGDREKHVALLANCLAQSQALAFGRTEREARRQMTEARLSKSQIDHLVAHRTFPGNRPSTTILFETLDAHSLGRLIALYEHKVFVQGAIWGINSFDQWGVELGKDLAGDLIPVLGDGATLEADSSTLGLVKRLRGLGARR